MQTRTPRGARDHHGGLKKHSERLIASPSYRAPCSPTASRLVGIMKAAAVLVGTPCIWMPPFGHHEDRRRRTATRQRARSRWRRSPKVGGESSADDKPSRRADSASCAGLGRRVHHPIGRSRGHIRACPYSLVESQRAALRACSPSQFLRRRCRARDFILLITRRSDVRFRGQSGKPVLILSLTGSTPGGHLEPFPRLAYRP